MPAALPTGNLAAEAIGAAVFEDNEVIKETQSTFRAHCSLQPSQISINSLYFIAYLMNFTFQGVTVLLQIKII